MSPTERTADTSTATHNPRVLVAVVLFVPLFIALALATFVWPAARLGPRDLPIGVAGPPQATEAIEQRLANSGESFAVHHYIDDAAARNAIENRDVYGAIVASPDGQMTLLTASAASPVVAQLLQQAFEPAPSQAVMVDVVPADSNDPRGAALSASVLPLVLSGTIVALLVTTVALPGLMQAGGLVSASLLAGPVAAAIVQSWLGVIGGSWLANAGVLSLTVLSIASIVAGSTALMGRAGMVLAALVIVFVGNAFSGLSTAPEMLPRLAGDIGQLLPPGAGGNLLRSTAFFDAAGAGRPLAVLTGWTALGLTAIWAGALLKRRTMASVPQTVGQPVLR